jgi:hypothetical protein
MANDAIPGSLPVSPVHGSQAPKQSTGGLASGNSVPHAGKGSPPTDSAAVNKADPQVLVDQLNKFRNDSGRPSQFRVDPSSRGQTIQEINPATGAVIGEFSISQFPELARSIGVSGVLVDSRA